MRMKVRIASTLSLLLLLVSPLYAQPISPPIPIHGHPQLKAYTDQSQLPTFAGHTNWGPGENPVASTTGSDGVLVAVIRATPSPALALVWQSVEAWTCRLATLHRVTSRYSSQGVARTSRA